MAPILSRQEPKIKAFGIKQVSYYIPTVMVKNIRHKGLERFYSAGNKAGIQAKHADRLRLILGRLDAAYGPKDMDLPGLRLHKLKGRLKNFWAVDVSGSWRVTFKFDNHDVVDVDYLDYH